ncbi:MAG: dTDP-glucose 4,6-dehydratase [Clostridiales bacterium]|nr:dTDP-glucose 4,6-dehydratase [Clostridiales bacterium]
MTHKEVCMKFLITGGAGFIGSNFCHYFYNENDDFVVFDALTYAGNKNNLRELLEKPNFKFIHGNICDEKMVDELFKIEKFDCVINFAAESNVESSMNNPQIFIDSNITGVRVLLDACKKYNVKRFHQISTDEVYGELLDNESQFYEESSLKPNNVYSVTKAAADMLVLNYHKIFGLNVTISRCSNNFGKYQHYEKFIPKTIRHILNDENVPVHGDGLNVRDWIYVLDHCRAIDLILKNGVSGEVYNVGCHNERTNLEIAQLILKLMGFSSNKIQFIDDRITNDKRYSMNYDKIAKELGYEPKYEFEKCLKDTIEWYEGQLWRQ